MSGEDAAAVDRGLEAMGAIAEARPALARRVVVLADRLDRLARHDEAATARRLREAEVAGDDARQGEVDDWVARLADEPVAAARRLRATPEGCDRLIGLWSDLGRCLSLGMGWDITHVRRAEALSGHDPSYFAPSEWALISPPAWGGTPHRLSGSGAPSRDPEHVAAARAEARSLLAARIDDEVRSLRERRTRLAGDQDRDAARAEAEALALFDHSKEAALLRRYEMATERGLYRALRELERAEPEAQPAPVERSDAVPEAEAGAEIQAEEGDASRLGSFGAGDLAPSGPARGPLPSPLRVAFGRPIGPIRDGLAACGAAAIGLA